MYKHKKSESVSISSKKYLDSITKLWVFEQVTHVEIGGISEKGGVKYIHFSRMGGHYVSKIAWKRTEE